MLNKILFITLLLLTQLPSLTAQKSEWPALDKSPMDAVTYPAKAAWRNYYTGDDRTVSPIVQIYYSRPQKNDREIFGGLIPYGKEWRLGANQATELLVYKAIDIGGVPLTRGAYSLFATPSENSWTLHISTETNIWGNNNRDLSQDILSIEVPVEKVDKSVEALSMSFQKIDDDNISLGIVWDKTRVKLPINLNPLVFDDLDVSPMDEAIYPVSANGLNYIEKDQHEANKAMIRIRYSRPQKKGRDIFGGLLEYGKIWRIGANQSTLIRFYQDVTIGDIEVKAGRYNLYAIVNKENWEFILNKDMPAWGPANRDEAKDIARFTMPVTTEKEVVEALSIKFEDQEDGTTHILIAWDDHRARIPVSFK